VVASSHQHALAHFRHSTQDTLYFNVYTHIPDWSPSGIAFQGAQCVTLRQDIYDNTHPRRRIGTYTHDRKEVLPEAFLHQHRHRPNTPRSSSIAATVIVLTPGPPPTSHPKHSHTMMRQHARFAGSETTTRVPGPVSVVYCAVRQQKAGRARAPQGCTDTLPQLLCTAAVHLVGSSVGRPRWVQKTSSRREHTYGAG